jgi:hypothetical protein
MPKNTKPEYTAADIQFILDQKMSGQAWAKVLWIKDIEEGGTTSSDAASQLGMSITQVEQLSREGRETIRRRQLPSTGELTA